MVAVKPMSIGIKNLSNINLPEKIEYTHAITVLNKALYPHGAKLVPSMIRPEMKPETIPWAEVLLIERKVSTNNEMSGRYIANDESHVLSITVTTRRIIILMIYE